MMGASIRIHRDLKVCEAIEYTPYRCRKAFMRWLANEGVPTYRMGKYRMVNRERFTDALERPQREYDALMAELYARIEGIVIGNPYF